MASASSHRHARRRHLGIAQVANLARASTIASASELRAALVRNGNRGNGAEANRLKPEVNNALKQAASALVVKYKRATKANRRPGVALVLANHLANHRTSINEISSSN